MVPALFRVPILFQDLGKTFLTVSNNLSDKTNLCSNVFVGKTSPNNTFLFKTEKNNSSSDLYKAAKELHEKGIALRGKYRNAYFEMSLHRVNDHNGNHDTRCAKCSHHDGTIRRLRNDTKSQWFFILTQNWHRGNGVIFLGEKMESAKQMEPSKQDEISPYYGNLLALCRQGEKILLSATDGISHVTTLRIDQHSVTPLQQYNRWSIAPGNSSHQIIEVAIKGALDVYGLDWKQAWDPLEGSLKLFFPNRVKKEIITPYTNLETIKLGKTKSFDIQAQRFTHHLEITPNGKKVRRVPVYQARLGKQGEALFYNPSSSHLG